MFQNVESEPQPRLNRGKLVRHHAQLPQLEAAENVQLEPREADPERRGRLDFHTEHVAEHRFAVPGLLLVFQQSVSGKTTSGNATDHS